MSKTQNLVPLAPMTEEYGVIEYQLQLQLNAPKLKIADCYILKNAHIEAQYLNYCKALDPVNSVDVFVPVSSLSQTISDIAEKGLTVNPNTGFSFRVGSFEINRNQETIEVIRFTVALGNTLNFQSSSSQLDNVSFAAEPPKNANLHAGYHSLCISENQDYVIFNSAQIKACQIIKFHGGEDLEEHNEDGELCDSCGKEIATIWCSNDNAKFCEKCDAENHESKISKKHKRMPLSEARALMEFCPFHPDQRVEYYCTECQTPVCIQCKMIGSHSRGDPASHQLVSIKQAYAEALEAAQREDPIFIRRRKQIGEMIASADAKLDAVVKNEKDVEAEIMRLANAAIERARQLAGEKALVVRSQRTELDRKLSEVDTLSKFVQAQRSAAGPLTFLRAFDRHSAVVASLQNTDDLPKPLTVEADLTVYGNLTIGSSGFAPEPEQEPVLQQEIPKPKMASRTSSKKDVVESQESEVISSQKVDDDRDDSSQYFENTEESQPVTPPRSRESPKAPSMPAAEEPRKPPTSPRPEKKRPEPISLIDMATKKEAKNKQRGMELTFQPFDNSLVITQSFACALYLCFPFRAQPQTHLLFSTERDGRSISRMHQLIDNIGITCVLIKKGDYVFGGFAAAKWTADGAENKTSGTSSFLFSLSLDAYIPYKPRSKDACPLYATPDTLTFGKFDLILADNFDSCSAVIENSYGVGFEPGSTEAQTFLAGEATFRADVVEVWGFFTIEQ